MRDFALPCAYAALVWWFTTGAILFLDGRAARTFRWSMAAASLVLAASLWQLRSSAADIGITGAYVAFTSAILVWGWLEMSFLMGYITGPRTSGCRTGCAGWRHFLHASQAVIYNELVTLAAAGCISWMTWGMPNKTALWTFVVLWIMRISAKLNLFLGVANLGERFLPPHLQYLKTFFRRRPLNGLFPLSIAGSSLVFVVMIERCLNAGDTVQRVSHALPATLLGLAILEHWFMILPLPSEKLWSWALRSERSAPETPRLPVSDSAAPR